MDLEAELAAMRHQLGDAQDTIEAIRTGGVDAFLIAEGKDERVYTLQTAERPYRVLVESMQQGAVVLGPDGTILFGNGRIAELLNKPHDRLAGARLADCVDPANRPDLESLIARGHREGASSGEVVLICGRARTPVHFTIASLPGGKEASLCVIVTDLTREKEHQALERDREMLQHSEAVLRDADRRKDEFLATLAHELRMPLAPIRSALEVLRLKGAVSPEVEWGQNVIGRQVKRMTRLVDDLLDLGRVTHDQLTLQRIPVDLSEILRAALEIVGPLIEQAGHELLVVVPRGAITVEGDAGRLTQMFANLITNACNFTDRYGSIEVRVETYQDVATITIRDSGAGISPELMPHIFEMFRRSDRSQGHERGGLGIGLALVKKVALLHGGTVSVASKGEGQGTTATVRLPRIASEVVMLPSGEYASEGSSCGKRIMVVDDDVDTADALATMLRLHGDPVRAAYDGTMALELGREFEPQVILLDVSMRGIDGLATCRSIRAEEWGEGVHIIAVTGSGLEADRLRTREAGFDHHLLKPVDPGSLSLLLQGLGPRRNTPWPEFARQ